MSRSKLHSDLTDALALATRSPSSHNSQAWLLKVTYGVPPLLCAGVDPQRALRSLPFHRTEMLLSLGALWHAVELGLRERGWCLQRVTPPPGEECSIAANIAITRTADITSRTTSTIKAISTRRTARGNYAAAPLSVEECRLVTRAVTGCTRARNATDSVQALIITDQKTISDVTALARTGVPRDFLHPVAWPETWSFLRTESELRSKQDGFAARDVFGPENHLTHHMARFFCSPAVMRIVGRLGVARTLAEAITRLIGGSPGLLMLTAKPAVWQNSEAMVEAGAAMHNVWLAAETLGLGCHPVSVLIQYEDLRRELARRTGSPDLPFFLARIGHPMNDPSGPPSPRRPASQILEEILPRDSASDPRGMRLI